jgi:hypothetical protein
MRRQKADALGLGAEGERTARQALYGERRAVDRRDRRAVDRAITRNSVAS